MKNWRRLTAILMVSVMCMGTVPTSFAAEEDENMEQKTSQENLAEDNNAPQTQDDAEKRGMLDSDDIENNTSQDTTSADNLQTGEVGDGLSPENQNTNEEGENAGDNSDHSYSEDGYELGSGAISDKEGNVYNFDQKPVSDEVQAILDNEEKLKEILATKYIIDSKDEVSVIGADDFFLTHYYDQNNIKHYYTMPSDGLDIRFFLWVNNIKERDTVYALHQKNDGTWEIIPASVEYTAANGPEITVHVNSLSPIAIVKVMSDGSIKMLKEKEINSSGNDGQSATAIENNQKKSPKTGIF